MTAKELGELAGFFMRSCEEVLGRSDFEDTARAALCALTEDSSVEARHPAAVYLLREALAVDMTRERNRKGELPAALGLVDRRSKATFVKHRAIISMIDSLQDHQVPDPQPGDLLLPYLELPAAAAAVVEGFYEAGIDKHLTVANVCAIYRRRGPRIR